MRCKIIYLIVSAEIFKRLEDWQLNEGYEKEIFLYSGLPQIGPTVIEGKITVPEGHAIIFPGNDKKAREKIFEIAGVKAFMSATVNVE